MVDHALTGTVLVYKVLLATTVNSESDRSVTVSFLQCLLLRCMFSPLAF